MTPLMRWIVTINVVCIVAFLLLRVAGPIGVDTIFIADTLFLTNLGWRGVNGYLPHFDYAHFYGGVAERFMTFGFRIFGTDFKSVDYIYVFVFLTVAAVLLLLIARRLKVVSASLVIVLAAYLILSANDIEGGFYKWASHAFLYNHIAISLMMGLIIFSCRESDGPRWLNVIAAVSAGIALVILVLLKTPFAAFSVALYAACAVQKRWRDLGIVTLGVVVAFLAFDPTFTRITGSFEILFSSAAYDDSGGIAGRLERMVSIVIRHTPYLALLVIFAVPYVQDKGRAAIPLLASILFCFGGFGAATLVMAGVTYQILLPAIVAALVLLADRLWELEHRLTRIAYISAFILAAGLFVPGFYSSGLATWRSFQYADSTLIDSGPMASYILYDDRVPDDFLDEPTAADRRRAALEQNLDRIAAKDEKIIDSYLRLADGWALLSSIPDIQSYGIISSQDYLDFTYPLQSKIVPSYPVWATANSVPRVDFDEVDIVMETLFHPDEPKFNDEMLSFVETVFRPCRKSALYILHTRRDNDAIACDYTATP